MNKHRSAAKKIYPPEALLGESEALPTLEASAAETAHYVAEMASEMATLACTARLDRLALLLDFVRRAAEAEAGAECVIRR